MHRAAALGDGWHGLWRTPDQVVAARAVLATATRRPFSISVRTKAHTGRQLTGADADSALHGDDAAVIARAAEFAEAAVDELVVEPQATALDGFLEELSRLAGLIVRVN